ncbi:hypothetical protein WH96_05185 [Kiloniella spongiae]|uniref:HTH deoR-type domain-containing protein n=1 Tax=Kiloniella spongiae TaxID=1489064 RepID=A0A0H2MH39_9PROT|nr:YafY family protein [Kiloniella spongiae]KLN61713.1 hypothetical protein WH96_05185 [Kiloniella spongiae]
MRASRLLSILMRLQKGQVTAEELSKDLEVSVRTIYRDMDHLSFAGVPVYADRGRAGGFQLLDGWQMPVTGLTTIEAEALLLSGMPDQVRQLGLQSAMLSGQEKILDTLSAPQKDFIGKISGCVHVDPVSWFGAEEPAEDLRELADAVWNQRKISCVYESWRGEVQRELCPLGLVVKGGKWYLVALAIKACSEQGNQGKDNVDDVRDDAGDNAGNNERIYRVGKFQKVSVLGEGFHRPKNFDLVAVWRKAVRRYEANIYQDRATLRINEEGLRQLPRLGEPVVRAVMENKPEPDPDGFVTITIPIETLQNACADILQLGSNCQVLAPQELVDEMKDTVRKMANFYA